METHAGRPVFRAAQTKTYSAAEGKPRDKPSATARGPSEAPAQLRGRVLGGRYELTGIIGHGGMATVWHARDLTLGRDVAVKILAPQLAADPRVAARFLQEARAAAALAHQNVVAVFDTSVDDGDHYIVLELVDGESLAERLRREGRLPVDEALTITSQVLAALQAAHKRALVHSDVTPCNIMLPRQGGAKVVDFGIARAIDDGSPAQTRSMLGTVAYLSPEQAAARPLDPRSDLYSLGCVLFEMLTGRPPFATGTPLSIAAAHVHRRPEPPSRLRPGLTPAVDALVLRALSKDREERHSSAGAMAAAVGALLRDLPKGTSDDRDAAGTGYPPDGGAGLPAGAAFSATDRHDEPGQGPRTPASSVSAPQGAQPGLTEPAPHLHRPGTQSGRRRTLIVGLVVAALIGFGLIALALGMADGPRTTTPSSDPATPPSPASDSATPAGPVAAPDGADEAERGAEPAGGTPRAASQNGTSEKAGGPEMSVEPAKAADRAAEATRAAPAGGGG